MFTKGLEPTGSGIEDSNLFLKMNKTKENILGSLLTESKSQDEPNLFLTTEVLSDLLSKIKCKLATSKQGEEVAAVDEDILTKALTQPSMKTVQKICMEVLQDIWKIRYSDSLWSYKTD